MSLPGCCPAPAVHLGPRLRCPSQHLVDLHGREHKSEVLQHERAARGAPRLRCPLRDDLADALLMGLGLGLGLRRPGLGLQRPVEEPEGRVGGLLCLREAARAEKAYCKPLDPLNGTTAVEVQRVRAVFKAVFAHPQARSANEGLQPLAKLGEAEAAVLVYVQRQEELPPGCGHADVCFGRGHGARLDGQPLGCCQARQPQHQGDDPRRLSCEPRAHRRARQRGHARPVEAGHPAVAQRRDATEALLLLEHQQALHKVLAGGRYRQPRAAALLELATADAPHGLLSVDMLPWRTERVCAGEQDVQHNAQRPRVSSHSRTFV
mmetsp:Transcript_110829/g.313492  ORF Transcript_110829/g.313492 Transcript_110829/m.313492 type:complete len:321 (-) Transcript_110829:1057-2019(-)